jgi:hypothetical protein
MLERRMLSEKRMLLEVDKKDGDINASARPQEYIDGTGGGYMRDAVFTVYKDGMEGQMQYFYTCVSNRDKPLEGQIPEEKVGTIIDQNNKIVTPAQLGLIPGYVNKLSVACQPVYDDLAKWRQTFCANLKNKTKPNYAWNCPEAAKPVAAAAETYVMPEVTDEGEGPIQQAASYKSLPSSTTLPFNGKIAYLLISDYIMWRWQSETARHIRYFTTGTPFTLAQGTPKAKEINYPRGTDITDLVVSLTK